MCWELKISATCKVIAELHYKFTFSEVMYGLRPVVRVVGEDERFATSQVAARSHYYHTG